MALRDSALEGDKEALGPPGPNSTLHVRAGNRPEPPALGSVLVEELLKLPAGHLCMANGLARDWGGPEIISPVLASSGTIPGLFSLLGAHEVDSGVGEALRGGSGIGVLRSGTIMACDESA
jgi:hypothetical protein